MVIELIGLFGIMMLPMIGGGITFVLSQKAVEGEF
jgi:hypothetical protein